MYFLSCVHFIAMNMSSGLKHCSKISSRMLEELLINKPQLIISTSFKQECTRQIWYNYFATQSILHCLGLCLYVSPRLNTDSLSSYKTTGRHKQQGKAETQYDIGITYWSIKAWQSGVNVLFGCSVLKILDEWDKKLNESHYFLMSVINDEQTHVQDTGLHKYFQFGWRKCNQEKSSCFICSWRGIGQGYGG